MELLFICVYHFVNYLLSFFRFNLTQLEEWCRINQLHENYGVVEELEPITEIVQLLQVNKKSTADVDGIIEIATRLNSLQVMLPFFVTYVISAVFVIIYYYIFKLLFFAFIIFVLFRCKNYSPCTPHRTSTNHVCLETLYEQSSRK